MTIIYYFHLLIIWCKVMYNMYNIDGMVVVCEVISNIRTNNAIEMALLFVGIVAIGFLLDF